MAISAPKGPNRPTKGQNWGSGGSGQFKIGPHTPEQAVCTFPEGQGTLQGKTVFDHFLCPYSAIWGSCALGGCSNLPPPPPASSMAVQGPTCAFGLV